MNAGATICGFYGRNNLGDEAILGGMVDLLATTRPGEAPLVLTDNPSASRAAHGIDAVSTRNSRGPRQLIGANLTRAVLGRRDFILGGGDLLRDSPHQDVVGPWLSHLERAQRLRRRSAVVGISVGDLWRPRSLQRIRSTLSRVSFVITRDDPSAARLREIGVQAEITVGPDLALRLFPRRSSTAQQRTAQQIVVCVRGLADRADERSASAHQHALRELAAALDVLSTEGSDVHIVPLRSLAGRLQPIDDDYVAGLEVAHLAVRGHAFTVHRHVPSVSALRDVLSTADLVIGMRLHSIIMAVGLGIPAIALAYDPKVTQFCAEVGIQSCCDLGSTDRELLVEQARDRTSVSWEPTERPEMHDYRSREVLVEATLRDW